MRTALANAAPQPHILFAKSRCNLTIPQLLPQCNFCGCVGVCAFVPRQVLATVSADGRLQEVKSATERSLIDVAESLSISVLEDCGSVYGGIQARGGFCADRSSRPFRNGAVLPFRKPSAAVMCDVLALLHNRKRKRVIAVPAAFQERTVSTTFSSFQRAFFLPFFCGSSRPCARPRQVNRPLVESLHYRARPVGRHASFSKALPTDRQTWRALCVGSVCVRVCL